jgi:hypothetical protein
MTLHQACVFAYVGISGSCSAFGWDQHRVNKKHAGTCYAELLFLQPVGSVGHVVYSDA